MDEDDLPKKTPVHEVGMVLDSLSVGELKERIEILENEIVRLRKTIEMKSASRSAADAVFKS